MIVYKTHNYSLFDCEIIKVGNVEYIMSFDSNNFCKDHKSRVRIKLKEYLSTL